MKELNIYKGFKNNFDINETESRYLHFSEKNSYIVEINNKPIGYFNVVELKGIEKLTIEYALLNSYRKKGIGSYFLDIVNDYIGKNYPSYEELSLFIDYDNKPSIKVANNCGYIKTINYDMNESENSCMELYNKKNKYYKKENIKKI